MGWYAYLDLWFLRCTRDKHQEHKKCRDHTQHHFHQQCGINHMLNHAPAIIDGFISCKSRNVLKGKPNTHHVEYPQYHDTNSGTQHHDHHVLQSSTESMYFRKKCTANADCHPSLPLGSAVMCTQYSYTHAPTVASKMRRVVSSFVVICIHRVSGGSREAT